MKKQSTLTVPAISPKTYAEAGRAVAAYLLKLDLPQVDLRRHFAFHQPVWFKPTFTGDRIQDYGGRLVAATTFAHEAYYPFWPGAEVTIRGMQQIGTFLLPTWLFAQWKNSKAEDPVTFVGRAWEHLPNSHREYCEWERCTWTVAAALQRRGRLTARSVARHVSATLRAPGRVPTPVRRLIDATRYPAVLY